MICQLHVVTFPARESDELCVRITAHDVIKGNIRICEPVGAEILGQNRHGRWLRAKELPEDGHEPRALRLRLMVEN
ncbi:hypothetical protein GCM10027417_11790 [Glutamicibacter endophyticus]